MAVLTNTERSKPSQILPYDFLVHTGVNSVTVSRLGPGSYTFTTVRIGCTCRLLPVLRTRRIVFGYDVTDPYYLLDRDLIPYYLLGNRL
jgi:hypothetical protein